MKSKFDEITKDKPHPVLPSKEEISQHFLGQRKKSTEKLVNLFAGKVNMLPSEEGKFKFGKVEPNITKE